MNHAPYSFFRLAMLAALAVLCAGGCGELQLAQTNDVELRYAVDLGGPSAATRGQGDEGRPQDDMGDKRLVAAVRARLGAARVPADVRVQGDTISVTIDKEYEGEADRVLRWRGGISLHRTNAETKIGDAPPTGPPLVDFVDRIAKVKTSRRGHDLTIFTTVTMRTPPKEPLAVAMGDTVLAIQPIEHAPSITVSFGDDLGSFARADRARMLLQSPTLPRLVKQDASGVPPHWGIAVLGLLLPVLLSFGWLSFVQRFDRARPEPAWLVAITFALGGLAAVLAWGVEYALTNLTPYLHPTQMTFGGQLAAAPLALVVFTVVVGLPEEGSKWLGAWFARRRPEFDEPVDGIVYGVASALGFAAFENIRYFALGRLAPGMIVLRAFTSLPVHMFLGAIWGYALGQKLVSPKASVLKFVLLAALLHGAYDTFLSVHGLSFLTLLLHLGLTTLFVVLLRRSLRRGVISRGDAIPESSRRLSVSFGSTVIFVLWAISLHLIAAAIVSLGLYFDATNQRVNASFLIAGTGLLVLFGVAAHGLVGSLPLEAVIDENGVTYGGATCPWSAIQRFEKRRASSVFGEAFELIVHSPRGPLRVGPGKETDIDALAAFLRASGR